VLIAAIEEYSARGWAGLTMDGVAKRAGVGKSTIYLRWSNKEDLLAAAIRTLAHDMTPLDTGSVRGDLERLAATLVKSYATPIGWGLIRILIDVAGSGAAVSELREVSESHRAAAMAIFERGIARGELEPKVPSQLVVNSLYGTLTIFRMMHPWDELAGMTWEPETLVRESVAFVMRGIEPWIIREGGS
jgi:AcrR family transcriptional regulator